MELTQLSSNWKALQKKLQAQESTHGAVQKRKRPSGDVEERDAEAKRVEPLSSSVNSRGQSKRRRVMSATGDSQRARSHSAPYKRTPDSVAQHSALKPSRSQANLKQEQKKDGVNAGNSQTHVAGKYIAMDCEMVGIGPAPHATSQLARVSLVNIHGEQVYDSFVTPKLPVADYRTHVSGITPAMLARGRAFEEVQEDVATLLTGRILVGHAVRNDLAALLLSHPKSAIRDTSRHKPWREQHCNGGIPSLRLLVRAILGWDSFQEGQHDSVEDARAAMMLFKSDKDGFEAVARRRTGAAAEKPKAALTIEGSPSDQDDATLVADKAVRKKKKKKKRKKGKT